MSRIKKIGSIILKCALIGFISLLLLELAYRFQWIDFYSTEWSYQNEQFSNHKDAKQRIIVFGDSFSADQNSWVALLGKDSAFQMYNASIPGIGPETQRLIAKSRIAEVNPDVIIVQLYVGNDLFDIEKPVNWSRYSFTRNLFWSSSNYFRSLNFLNYRLGQMSAEDGIDFNPKADTLFNPEIFSPREKMYIQGNANYPENVITVFPEYKKCFEKLISFVEEIKGYAPKKCSFKVMLIPHSCEVNLKYVNRFHELGSNVDDLVLTNNFWQEEFDKRAFEMIDVKSALIKSEKSGSSTYFNNDIHLNETGQQLVYNEVIKILK